MILVIYIEDGKIFIKWLIYLLIKKKKVATIHL